MLVITVKSISYILKGVLNSAYLNLKQLNFSLFLYIITFAKVRYTPILLRGDIRHLSFTVHVCIGNIVHRSGWKEKKERIVISWLRMHLHLLALYCFVGASRSSSFMSAVFEHFIHMWSSFFSSCAGESVWRRWRSHKSVFLSSHREVL